MNILAISGALRLGSYNTALLRNLQALAPDGMAVDVATLHDIPLYDGDDEARSGKPDAVTVLDGRIRKSTGVIISTPEYNFSVPGVLKNATDWLSRRDNPFRGKPVGVMGVSGGPLGAARAQYHLRQNLQGLEAITMPKPEIFVGLADTKFDDSGNLTDETTQTHLSRWLAAFAAWATAHGAR